MNTNCNFLRTILLVIVIHIYFFSSYTQPVICQSNLRVVEIIKNKRAETLTQGYAAINEFLQQANKLEVNDLAAELQALIPVTEKKPQFGGPPPIEIFVLKKLPEVLRLEISETLPQPELDLRKSVRKFCDGLSQELFELSQESRRAKSPSLMFELLLETLKYNPDHEKARQMLGFVPHEGLWMTPFEKDQLRIKKVNHPEFGWIPIDHVERYEKGERYFNTRWITVEKEKEIRSDFRKAWEIRTENFYIKTNISLERGVQVSRALEEFFYFFRCMCTGFYSQPEQTSGMVNINSVYKNNSAKFEVHIFKNKQEYVDRLKSKFPFAEITNGMYFHNDKIAFFFDQEDQETFWQTLFHEATHQFMFESSPGMRTPGSKEYFWPIEGIACYMESFKRGEKEFTAGDPTNIRFRYARFYLLDDKKHVPLGEFSDMGMEAFQRETNIDVLQYRYAYSSGLSHFFIHYKDGIYKDAFLMHLSQIYSNKEQIRLNADSISELTGVSNSELDKQYQEYIKEQGEYYDRGRKLMRDTTETKNGSPDAD